MLRYLLVVAVGGLLLSGCSDPEKAAEKALTEAQADWIDAKKSLDPKKRAAAYQRVIKDVNAIASKYKKTQAGQGISAGRTVSGLSLPTMQREYDRLAERADCYASPTVDCLGAFASDGYKYQQSNAGGAGGNALQVANEAVCKSGFKAAADALENMKINRPVYASNLIQVALSADKCDRPKDVVSAVEAYLAVEPSQGMQRANALLSLLNTEGLKAAWPTVIEDLEQVNQSLPPSQSAGIDMALAVHLAEMGEANQAMAKYHRVTDELGFQVNSTTRLELTNALVASGAIELGMSLYEDSRKWDNMAFSAIHLGTQKLGGRLGIIRAAGSPNVDMGPGGDLKDLFAPVSDEVRARESIIAESLEAGLDKYVAFQEPKGYYLGGNSPDSSYARLAFIWQKMGDPGRANALIEKSLKTREALSSPGSYDPSQPNYGGEYMVMTALAQGDTDKAAALLPTVMRSGNDIQMAVLRSLARSGDAEKMLVLANQFNRTTANNYQVYVRDLGEGGHIKKAEQVLNSFPGSANSRAALAWGLVEMAAEAGKIGEAESLVETYSLLDIPAYRIRLAELRATDAIKNNQKGKAEKAIRDYFAIGQEFDERARQDGVKGMYSQEAARTAFSAGYTDLGIELYTLAPSRDQRPLFAAFSEATKRSDYPKILMTAHDNLSGDPMSYVVDAAIRGLKGDE